MTTPSRRAATLSGSFLLLSSAYIVVSGLVAKIWASSTEQLARYETWKGLGFMALCALLLYFFSRAMFRRQLEQQELLMERSRQLEQAEHRARACLLAATLLHDARNIMTALAGATALLKEHVRDHADLKDVVDSMDQAVDRVIHLAERMKDTRDIGGDDRREDTDLAQLARTEMELLRRHERVGTCEVRVDAKTPVRTSLYKGRVEQMLFNLVLNAAEATDGKGPLEVKVRLAQTSGRGAPDAVLEVHDAGPGIPEGVRSRIFDPYFTTKRHGTGLGLPSVEACVLAHEGRLEVGQSPLGGALFRVVFPARTT